MSARNISRDVRVQQLRAAYKEAFDEWAFAITRLQVLTRASAASEYILEAQNRVAEAYLSYRETRDLLAAHLVDLRSDVARPAKIVPFKTTTSAAHR